MGKGGKALIIAASAFGIIAIAGLAMYFSLPDFFERFSDGGDEGSQDGPATITENNPPAMMLTVLQSNEDSAAPIARYEANHSEPIPLAVGQHIRFESPDRRNPEGMTVVARSAETGAMELLRKSYALNNQFFLNLDEGSYQLQVEARWFDAGTHHYPFNVRLTR